MRPSLLSRALLTAALSTFLVAQNPATDLQKLRQDARAAVEASDWTKAAAAYKKLTDANAKDAQAWHMLGYTLHAAGKLDDALQVHLKAREFPAVAGAATYNVACVYALQGKPDDAFQWLDKAIAAGFDDLEQLRGDSDFASIRKDPRMAKVEEKLKDAGGAAGAQVFAQSVERKNARVAWFSRAGAPQLSLDFSPVAWQDKYEEAIASGKFQGKKWRLGADFWTRLDTSVELRCGATVVPAGYYYLTVEQRDGDRCVLALHDPAAVKKQKVDAFMAEKLQGGIEVALTHEKLAAVARNLDIAIEMKPGSKTEGTLAIRFGGHALVTPFTARLE